jgi:hypothetical protein
MARGRVPTVLVVAVIVHLAQVLVFPMASALLSNHTSGPAALLGSLITLSSLRRASGVVVLVGYGLGAWRIGDQLGPRGATLARGAALGFAAAVAVQVSELVAMTLTSGHALPMLEPYLPVLASAALVGLCCACVRRARPISIALAGLAVLLVAIDASAKPLARALSTDPRLAVVILRSSVDLAQAIVAVVLVARVRGELEVMPPEPGPLGLREAGSALLARAVALLLAAALAVIVDDAPHGSPQRHASDALLLASVAVSAVVAAYLARAAGWTADRAPRYRLALASALVGWAGLIRLATTATLREREPMPDLVREQIPDVAWLPSSVELAGLLLVASAIATSARVLGADALRPRARRVGAALLVLVGGSIWVDSLPRESAPSWPILAIGSTLAAAAATWALARLARALPPSPPRWRTPHHALGAPLADIFD